MTPFARLALFYGSAIAAGIIAGVWIFVSPWIAVAAVVGGATIAVIATLEVSGGSASTQVEKPEEGPVDFTLRRRDRSEIERDARRSAEQAADDVSS